MCHKPSDVDDNFSRCSAYTLNVASYKKAFLRTSIKLLKAIIISMIYVQPINILKQKIMQQIIQ